MPGCHARRDAKTDMLRLNLVPLVDLTIRLLANAATRQDIDAPVIRAVRRHKSVETLAR